MDEASLCDRVALIQKGEILSINTPENITQQFKKTLFSVKTDNKFNLIKDLRNYKYQNSVNAFGQFVHYTDISENQKSEIIKAYLKEQNHKNIEVKIIKPGIEDCFIELMK